MIHLSKISVLIAVWGHPLKSDCIDNSDKVKNFNLSNTLDPCDGDEYTFYDMTMKKWITTLVDWKWFPCYHSQKCIHVDNVCDSHPHPDCIYSRDGLTISEDEENCSSIREFFCPFKRFKIVKNEKINFTKI